ncbi:glycosyltransferase family 4 protein [Sporofaciens musculi]|uniref:glycosyltransferase family 4 protein n=1 Tax=Sporofaciens musculi TaxID=2681861 RepID=UPI0025A1F049|nr:glycosyltransferase family 4 protein [Sporofaciens musculi]
MSKRYCIFSAQFLPHMGGVERYTYYIAKELQKRGEHVVVVTNNTTGSPMCEDMEGIQVYRFPCYSLLHGRFPVMKADGGFQKIHGILKQQNFDAVIINARFYIHSIYAARYALKKGIPCICIEHGTSHLSVHNIILDKIGDIYEHIHTEILKHYCKRYFGVSLACCQWMKHFNIKAEGVLYNAVNLEEIEDLKNRGIHNYREEYKIDSKDFIVAFTGRLLKEKGIYELIEAVERFNGGEKKIHLFLAGDGEEWKYVIKHRSNYIHPLGRKDFPEVIELLIQSDIFCLPSFSEGFPTSVLEAAACGCYIITTERGGAKELIIAQDYGIVMKDNRVDRIYSALKRAIDHEEVRKIGRNLCYKRLKENFTWEKTVDKIEIEV